MEIYEYDEEFDQVISAKFIGIGATGANVSDYFSEVGNDLFPERLMFPTKMISTVCKRKLLALIICSLLWILRI